MSAVERQLITDNSDVAHLMNVLVREMRSHVVERPLCSKEAAQFLGIGLRTLERWISNGTLPAKIVHYKGSRPYFFPSELVANIKQS